MLFFLLCHIFFRESRLTPFFLFRLTIISWGHAVWFHYLFLPYHILFLSWTAATFPPVLSAFFCLLCTDSLISPFLLFLCSLGLIVLKFVNVLDSYLGSCCIFAFDITQTILSYDDDLQNKTQNRGVLKDDAGYGENLAPLRAKGAFASRRGG